MAQSGTNRPVVLGLLGGICSGKSSVSQALAEHGARVLDADRLAKAALDDENIREAIRERMGTEVIDNAGSVDRAAVSQRVFSDLEELAWLEALIHPHVRKEIFRALESLPADGSVPAVVLDVPLLLEKDAYVSRCDLLVFVDCPEKIRQERAQRRRGWSADELQRREAHQMPLMEKQRRADVLLRNDGTEAELKARVNEWLRSSGGLRGLPRKK